MLVCVDGSNHSIKALEEAVKIAGGCNINDVSIIYVCEKRFDSGAIPVEGTVSEEDLERLMNYIHQCDYNKNQKLLLEARDVFVNNNIEAKTIFKEGHPAQTIVNEANAEGYDIVVVGRRGVGGVEALFLGSVSNAVIHEVKSNVYVVN